ncbi:hypothetical protein M2350_000927 [Candidatus Fervidibacter sacchari]|uniref:Uncharacterized protein n=1 Tax=Candidatus Fervidibacter sacchari TaxID=1448929 RepID=A0ABT2EKQ3_9BACT|nr:hypothetical protein [Candidatus Fervidibacter sacchari]
MAISDWSEEADSATNKISRITHHASRITHHALRLTLLTNHPNPAINKTAAAGSGVG